MKRFFSTVFLSTVLTSLAILLLSSCNKDTDTAGSEMTVTLEQVEATESTLTFVVNHTNAEKCAWWYGTADESVPSAEDILATGTSLNTAVSKSTVIIDDLPAFTEFVIVAAVSGKGNVLSSEPLKMTTLGSEVILLDAVYSDANSAGAGNYSIALGNSDINENWEPVNVGDMYVSLELFNVKDTDPINAVLPDGEYKAGSKTPFTWDPSSSYLCKRVDDTAEGVKYMPFISGAVNVARDGNTYSLDVDLVLLEGGEEIKVKYSGPIQFVQGATAAGRFEEPQNVTFTAASGRYYGNWFYPFSDDMLLEFYAGERNASGNLVDGYKLQMMYVFTQKLEDTSVSTVPIENGTYTVSYGTNHQHRVPRTFTKGEVTDFYGTTVELGTILKHIDSKTGRNTLGVITGGTMKVSGSGSSYTFEFNFVTEDGVEIKGSYSGGVDLQNKCDNSSREYLSSVLTSDYQLDFPESTKAMAYYMGDYLHVGLDSWLLYFMGDDPGDTISLEFFTDKNGGLQISEGIYTISGDYSEFKSGQIIPGFYPRGGGDLLYSWYGDTSSQDQDGNTQKLAPLAGGTMNVSKSGNKYVFNMNFTDDKGYTISGQWTGDVNFSDLTQTSGSTAESVRKQFASMVRSK